MPQVRQWLAPIQCSCLLACHQIPPQQLQVLPEVLQSLFRCQHSHCHLALRYLEAVDYLYLDNLLQSSQIQQSSLGGLLFHLLLLCPKQHHHQLQTQVLFHRILNHHFTHPIQDMVLSHLNLYGGTPILHNLLGPSSLPSSPILVL